MTYSCSQLPGGGGGYNHNNNQGVGYQGGQPSTGGSDHAVKCNGYKTEPNPSDNSLLAAPASPPTTPQNSDFRSNAEGNQNRQLLTTSHFYLQFFANHRWVQQQLEGWMISIFPEDATSLHGQLTSTTPYHPGLSCNPHGIDTILSRQQQRQAAAAAAQPPSHPIQG